MADATLAAVQSRSGALVAARLLRVTVTPSATVYAATSGGLPVDLAGVLTKNAPPDAPHIRPDDVLGVLPVATSTAGFIPIGLTKGTAVYTSGVLTSAPAFIKLVGIGSASTVGSALGQVADGANSDPFDVWLIIAYAGPNA
jgi:hypothetical protein